MNRTQLFNKLNAKPTNPYWSWCAMNVDRKFALFTIWEDTAINGRNPLTPLDKIYWDTNGHKDQQRVIKEVQRLNIPAYGIMCTVKDPHAQPRRIKKVQSDFLIRLKLIREGDFIYGVHRGKVHVLDIINDQLESAISDLPAGCPEGNLSPDRALSSGYSFKRDSDVRKHVLERADGHCEFCGKEGFLMSNGKNYIEAHHIIALSEQGPDTISNVIALCPEHHREAHYGIRADDLEAEFLKKLASLNPVERRMDLS